MGKRYLVDSLCVDGYVCRHISLRQTSLPFDFYTSDGHLI